MELCAFKYHRDYSVCDSIITANFNVFISLEQTRILVRLESCFRHYLILYYHALCRLTLALFYFSFYSCIPLCFIIVNLSVCSNFFIFSFYFNPYSYFKIIISGFSRYHITSLVHFLQYVLLRL